MEAEVAQLYNYLIVSSLLFGIGLIGFLVRRNMIVMFLCAELMFQGVAVSFVAWSRFHDDWGGQVFVLFMIVVAACEASIALALVLALYNRSETLDMAFWQDLREEGQPAFVDRNVPEEKADERTWPTLTTAGVEPEHDEDQLHRSEL